MRQRAIIVLSFAAALAVLLIFSRQPSLNNPPSSAPNLAYMSTDTMPVNFDDAQMTVVRHRAKSALNQLLVRQQNTQ
jgi:hypothetical protein